MRHLPQSVCCAGGVKEGVAEQEESGKGRDKTGRSITLLRKSWIIFLRLSFLNT